MVEMNMNCEEARELLSEYIDGVLESEQSEAVWQHIQECSECRIEYEQLSEIVFLLNGVPEKPLSQDFDLRLRRALRAEPAVKARYSRRYRFKICTAAAIFAVGICSLWAYNSIDWNNISQPDQMAYMAEAPSAPMEDGENLMTGSSIYDELHVASAETEYENTGITPQDGRKKLGGGAGGVSASASGSGATDKNENAAQSEQKSSGTDTGTETKNAVSADTSADNGADSSLGSAADSLVTAGGSAEADGLRFIYTQPKVVVPQPVQQNDLTANRQAVSAAVLDEILSRVPAAQIESPYRSDADISENLAGSAATGQDKGAASTDDRDAGSSGGSASSGSTGLSGGTLPGSSPDSTLPGSSISNGSSSGGASSSGSSSSGGSSLSGSSSSGGASSFGSSSGGSSLSGSSSSGGGSAQSSGDQTEIKGSGSAAALTGSDKSTADAAPPSAVLSPGSGELSRGVTAGSVSRVPDDDELRIKYNDVLAAKLKGCDYKVLYVEREGSAYVYRVRILSNKNGALIDQEFDFLINSKGISAYYANPMDTMQ